jgi:cyclophilin family peptidyl-prolyl cis-trans isomerase
VTEATGRDPGPGAAPPLPPPDGVSIRDVAGRTFRWELETTRGTVAIALRGELAPWHVATVRSLTRRGFYDGLVVHRVVPGFVAQGGDPTGTGWGGPGFTLPSEAGDAAYERGAVGFADAGKDTGGSQWFVMHAAAPHLEGRYTVIGRVVAGQDVVDALLVGDRVLRAAIVDP